MTTKASFEITATDKTAAAFASIEKSLDSMASKAKAVTELVGGYLGFEGLEHIVEVTAENEKAQALLESQLKATGDAVGYTKEQLIEYAEQLQANTTFSHEQVETVESELLAFTHVTGEQFKQTVQAILDFSTVTGRDAAESVRTLGQAINDPAAGMARLRQAGISLDEATKEQIKSLQQHGDLLGAQNLLLQMLEKSYGGAAAAARDTLGGALAGLKNDFNDLLEGDQGGISGVTSAVKNLDTALRDPDVKAGISSIVAGLLDLVGAAAKIGTAFANAGTALGEFFAKAQGYTGNFDDQISDLNGKIEQTKEHLATIRSSEGESEEVKQLMAQLADYQAKLLQVQEQQRKLIPASAQVVPTFHAAPTDMLKDISEMKMEKIDRPVDLVAGNNGELKSAYSQMLEDQKQVQAIWDQNDPSRKLQEEIDKTKALVGTVSNGEIFTAEDAQKHIEDLEAQFGKSTDQMSVFADQAARNIESTLGSNLFQSFDKGLRGMLEGWAKMLVQMLEQAESAQLLNHFFGSSDPNGKGSGSSGLSSLISKGISSFFGTTSTGSGHASGGPVTAGTLYPVSEAGTEMFNDAGGNSFLLPGRDGNIVPNSALITGGSTGGHTINIDARGAGPDETAKIVAMRNDLINTMRGETEHRLQRGGWPTSRRA